MDKVLEIIENSYVLTFGYKPDYDWKSFGDVFVNSENIIKDINDRELVNNEETAEELKYWVDISFMELAENIIDLKKNDIIYQKIRNNAHFKNNIKFLNKLPKVSKVLGRELLIDELIESDTSDMMFSDQLLESVIKKKSRDKLRKDFLDWNNEEESNNNDSKSRNFNTKKWLSIAAIFLIGFFLWQPTQKSNNSLFSNYTNNLDTLTKNNFTQLDLESSNNGERGDNFILKNFSRSESKKALSGLNYFRNGNYAKAKSTLKELDPKFKNNQILYFLSLSQLNTNEVNLAITNLEYLLRQSEFNLIDDVKFHLAMGHLKKGNRKESRYLLKDLINTNSKLKNQASTIIKDMRWP